MRVSDEAASDVKYLLDRGYRRASAMNYVSSRYGLKKDEKNALMRYAFSENEIRTHKAKKHPLSSIKDHDVVVDGYNVLITTECLIFSPEKVISCMDGFVRDASGVFGKYRFTDRTDAAIGRIIGILERYAPRSITFIFESPVSKSGDLCRRIEAKYGKDGRIKAITHKTVDNEIMRINVITATSDSAIIEAVDKVIDVPGYAYELDNDVRSPRGSSVP